MNYENQEEKIINAGYEREASYGASESTLIKGMNKKLFLELAFCRAFEIEFNQDEYNLMDNLNYDDDKYLCLQDVVEDEKMMGNIDEYADKIRNFINNLN